MDFEVKHLICAGLDVHKKTIVAAVCMTDPVTLEAAYKVKSFSTNNSQIAAMRDWLLSYNCHDVCMESTGKYWIPVFNILETHMHVVLTHPKYVKAVKSKKNPYYAIKYKRLAKRRGRKKAVIAIARMMLTSIYHMILNNEEWKPDDYEAIIHPSKPVKVALTLDNVIQFLGEQGADPETLKLLQQLCAVTPG